jgi:phosphatidylglycerophosphate synthase
MSMRNTRTSAAVPALRRELRAAMLAAALVAMAAILGLLASGAIGFAAACLALLLYAGFLLGLAPLLTAHHPYATLGTANRITIARAGAACLVAGSALDPAPLVIAGRWLLCAVATGALCLDGADGWAARREGLASGFGARFDLEVDAFAVLALSVAVARARPDVAWVLAIGAMRYLYLVAGYAIPALRRPLPAARASQWRRKTIAVIQSLALLVALVPPTPPQWAAGLCLGAVLLLAYSFGADILLQILPRSLPRSSGGDAGAG